MVRHHFMHKEREGSERFAAEARTPIAVAGPDMHFLITYKRAATTGYPFETRSGWRCRLSLPSSRETACWILPPSKGARGAMACLLWAKCWADVRAALPQWHQTADWNVVLSDVVACAGFNSRAGLIVAAQLTA